MGKGIEKQEYVFEGQKTDEDVVLAVRQHPFVLFASGLITVIILVIAVILVFKFGGSWISGWFFILALIFIISYGGRRLFMWYNQVYILTNQRIISVVQKGVFRREVTEVPLENIQNLSHETRGVFQTMLNFGEVELETAGIAKTIKLTNIAHPYQIQQRILEEQKREKVKLTGRGISCKI